MSCHSIFLLCLIFGSSTSVAAGTVSCVSQGGAFSRDDVLRATIQPVGQFSLVRLFTKTETPLRPMSGRTSKVSPNVSSSIQAADFAIILNSTGTCTFDQANVTVLEGGKSPLIK